jgi:hypothetical protein
MEPQEGNFSLYTEQLMDISESALANKNNHWLMKLGYDCFIYKNQAVYDNQNCKNTFVVDRTND